MLEIVQLPVLNDNYIYILHEPIGNQTAVVDPSLAGPVLDALNDKGWRLNYIFNTHHHHDHIGGNLELKQQTGCRIIASAFDKHRIPGIDRTVEHGDKINLGEETFEIFATPGHTNGHIVYYCESSKALFCGDTLFSLGCGRLFEGTAEQMWNSLQLIKALPESTRIYCAHEYTKANGNFALTIEADNPALQRRLEEVATLVARNQPTVPSTLSQELSTNPFLREQCVAVQETLGMLDQEPVDVFARIRQLKDRF
ncbi:hydroxyacylglutathione hydrolase [Methylomarinum vadi]|uniref:hydroxyacylglutathione hydrolase n=1 Tax=Methylomarinum vadi TaxID=438855 RepID=UPI0004DF9A3F|nr:hydroxyacylglutathione hydrolase [Methylomarinum vadi]